MKYAVDIDNTIFKSEQGENGEYILTGVFQNRINQVNFLYDSGNTIIMWTGRHWNHLEITKKQLKENNVKYTTLLMGKPDVDAIVDDKVVDPKIFFGE